MVIWNKILPKARLPMVPKIMPTMPPIPQSIPDSMRNWATMLLRCASRLRRIPISRVRSVTVTSMMFMIPMPPTSREMAAMPPSTREIMVSCWF
jgi:hypothetical protein